MARPLDTPTGLALRVLRARTPTSCHAQLRVARLQRGAGYDGTVVDPLKSENVQGVVATSDEAFLENLLRWTMAVVLVASGCSTPASSSCSGSLLKHSYAYDADGRVGTKTWHADSSGDAGTVLVFSPGDLGGGSDGALDTVFKAVSVNGAIYNYYYDASNRRRLKVYPAGPMDEAFQSATELLVDQGNDSVTSPTWYPTDEYIWLGHRPVILIRSKFNTSWARQADSAGDCTRNAEAAPCGFYFPVTDAIGKPVVMLDASRKVTGASDYDVFGYPNRVSLDKETAHPYANNTNITLADFIQPLGSASNPSINVRIRVIFDMIDTEGPANNPADYVFLKDPDGGAALTSHIGGPHLGQVWSPWVVPSAGRVQVPFLSNATGNTYTGVVMSGYEYQRYQVGAQPFWTPLGFPGQYRDAESDLFQNWNRFYDPATGRYLEPEPLLNTPSATTAVYAYANSSPLFSTDPTGLFQLKNDCDDWDAAVADARKWARCDCDNLKGADQTCKDTMTFYACDICKYHFLDKGAPPEAWVGDIAPAATGHTNVGAPGYVYEALLPGHPQANSIMVDRTLRCVGGLGAAYGRVGALTQTIFHEALHYCTSRFPIDQQPLHGVSEQDVEKVLKACKMP